MGVIGTSYGGFLVLMALVDPHPALKVAVAIAPMVDVWRGDDWFHNGAFRQIYTLDYAYEQTATRSSSEVLWRGGYDEYETFLNSGTLTSLAQATGADKLPFWQRVARHPAYDDYWSNRPSIESWRRRFGFPRCMWRACGIRRTSMAPWPCTEPGPRTRPTTNFPGHRTLAHGHESMAARSAPLRFDGDTGLYFRRRSSSPFWRQLFER